MLVRQAQHTSVVRLPGLLDAGEVQQIVRCAEDVRAAYPSAMLSFNDRSSLSKRGNWTTTYLHTGGHFKDSLPAIYGKLEAAAHAVDAENWQMMEGQSSGAQPGVPGVHVRTLEHHQVESGGSLPEQEHYDSGSLVTLDVMLSGLYLRFASP
jgi:hypothetical protein|eukprot:SAG25_NODE_235_length_11344_cov_3.848911_18_plen_152_part_00